MRIVIFFLILFLFIPFVSLADEQPDHYCDDSVAWQEWEGLLEKNPMDDGISSLYAFRVGLCSMVKSGRIETDRAIKLFERMRDAVLSGIYASEEQGKGKGT